MPQQQLARLKAVRPAPLTTTVPKNPFKSKAAATSKQMNSDKTGQNEKATFLHFGVFKEEHQASEWKAIRQHTQLKSSLSFSLVTLYGGRIISFRMILTP